MANLIKDLFHGKFLSEVKKVKNLPFLIYVASWALLVIYLSNTADKKAFVVSKLQIEVNDLTIKSTSIKTQLLDESKYSKIKKKAEELGLYQDKIPPKKITLSE